MAEPEISQSAAEANGESNAEEITTLKGSTASNEPDAAALDGSPAGLAVEAGTKTEAATETAKEATPDSKKRKHSAEPEDTRDWRVRREQDRNGRGSHKDGKFGQSRPKKLFKPYSENVKSDYSLQPQSSDPAEIRKQVEFYFSDSNLPTDKFLLEQTGGAANKPVPIKTLHSFKRMRHFQPFEVVVAALKDSDFLVVNDKDEVARKEPLAEGADLKSFEDKTLPKTIYAKGFGEEGPSTQFDIEAFFAPYGPTNAIRLRRTVPEKIFKGSVFVEFDSEEGAKQFLALENKPKFDGRDLKILSKHDYLVEKAKEAETAPAKAIRGRGGHRGHRGGGRGGAYRNGDRRRDAKPTLSARDTTNEDEGDQSQEKPNNGPKQDDESKGDGPSVEAGIDNTTADPPTTAGAEKTETGET